MRHNPQHLPALEVSRLLRRRDEEGLRIFPIIIKPCDWAAVPWLQRMNLRPKDGRALSGGTEYQIDRDLAEIAREIRLLLHPITPHPAQPLSPRPLRTERQQMLDREINHRIAALPVLLQAIFTFTQLHTAKGAVYGKAEHHPRLGKLGNFDPLFSEFQDQTLFALLWELRTSVSDQEQEKLDRALQAAEQLPVFFTKLTMVQPVGQEDSKWQINRESMQEYAEVLKRFDIGRWPYTASFQRGESDV